MKTNIIGVDVGGTKCAVTYGQKEGFELHIREKIRFATTDVDETIANIVRAVDDVMRKNGLTAGNTAAIGVSCGGPLDSRTGVVMSPPNLPGWDNIPIVKLLGDRFGIRTGIHNDANACALAEWKFGAGIGARNMAFLTFGTGLGAGLILDGKLYAGTNDNAGELGHIRLSDFGPVGYGKCGSFEGFASGGGIAQLARFKVSEKHQMGQRVSWCAPGQLDEITARDVADAAAAGDELALEIYRISATYLGRGLAIVIDLINPEVIVIGGIYTRNREMMEPFVLREIEREALSHARRVCSIHPAALGEQIGDYAALSVAADLIKE
ncbi:ROK family protein [Alistipes sp. dk3620]|uniref:ROK family protein n=1 Tax=unclassified Alistipes TaxID=2608932 RepID=UPI0012962112|nr:MULTISPECIES: ROK family protein [unclassified Alistipes]MQX28109.1 ROK family protein [Alistipes sp. dk3620]QGA23304.1 ROK family protein [Alistipes sp. dk3624]HIV60820.1 ROK family protein [Candidatus Alistipes pullistercoris]